MTLPEEGPAPWSLSRERGYADPYRASGDEVALLGVAFDCETHNVGSWLCEPL